MLPVVTAIRFARPMSVGRTGPCLLGCELEDGSEVEVVVKFSAGCEMKERSLMAEAVTAMLAADLDLPVPEPFAVKMERDLAATIPDPAAKTRSLASVGWNFGSRMLPAGFATIPKERSIPRGLIETAMEILAFDTFIANPDRTVANPNCLSNGREFAIFDHELAFFMDGILGWKAPWESCAIQFPKGQPSAARHVFLEELRGQPTDLRRLAGAFEAVSRSRLNEYRAALPADWIGDGSRVDRVLDYIDALRANIDKAIRLFDEALR